MKFFLSALLAVFSVSSVAALAQVSARVSAQVQAQVSAQAPAPSSAPVKATAATTTESPEIRELQKVEDDWSTALNKRDQYGLELVLSPLFVDVSAEGNITTRNQQVVSLINQEDKTAMTDLHVITVRMLGDVAVANGTYSFTHKGTGGQVEERGIFTHVFQRQHGNWLCLNAQRTLLREGLPAGSKAKATKTKSNSELPFHIPLFSKGDKSDKADKPNQ